MAVFTSKHGAVQLADRTGSPLVALLKPGAGNFTVQGMQDGPTDGSSYTRPAEALPIMSRGAFIEYVEGDETPITGTITIYQDGEVTHATNKTPQDAVSKTGAFAAGVTADDGAVVWTTDIVYAATRASTTIGLTLKNCRCKVDWGEAKEGNSYQISYECRGGYKWS